MKNPLHTLFLLTLVLAITFSAHAQPDSKQSSRSLTDVALGVWLMPNAPASRAGLNAMQDVFITELRSAGRFSVMEREQLQKRMKEKNLTLSGDIDPSTAVRVGKLLGVNYLLVGSVTEYGVTDKTATAVVTASLIDTSTGEIVWADEAKVSVGGFGGGVDDDRMFDRVMKPALQKLTASLKAADL